MNPGAADAILGALAEGRIVEPRVMIVVAHPDDETIGMGAQLCRFRDARLVQITDGAPRDGRDAATHGYTAVADYAFARRIELYAALAAGEAVGIRVEIIGVPDQEACVNLVSLAEIVARRVQHDRPSAIFVQPYEGGHPDHDAAAFAVRAACRMHEGKGSTPPAIIEMTGYHAGVGGLATGVFLPARSPVKRLALRPTDRSRKRRMIDCFATQRDLLAGFGTEIERFREAPQYDFLLPPHPGPLHYEGLGWGITGEIWRRDARAAIGGLGLPLPAWV